MCNTYCFSTATVGMWTRLSVTFLCKLAVLLSLNHSNKKYGNRVCKWDHLSCCPFAVFETYVCLHPWVIFSWDCICGSTFSWQWKYLCGFTLCSMTLFVRNVDPCLPDYTVSNQKTTVRIMGWVLHLLCADFRIILKWIWKKDNGRVWAQFIRPRLRESW
jgi:hypothetical protein